MEGTFAIASVFVILWRIIISRVGFDIVIYVGAQPAIAWAVRLIAFVQNLPYIVKITDLAAQAAEDVGIVRSRIAMGSLRYIEFSAYRKASAAIVLCRAFRDVLVANGCNASAIHIVSDSVDLRAIAPGPSPLSFRRKVGIRENVFVVLYAGSFGLKQNLIDAVKAAATIRDCAPNVRWVFIGEGETRPRLEEAIEELGVEEHVMLLPLQPERLMSEMFAASDALLLSQVSAMKDTVIPSKLLMYMASGRPVIAAVNPMSQAAALLQESRGGIVVRPEDPCAIVEAVKHLVNSPNECAAMARLNREYAVQHFDRDVILRVQQEIIENTLISMQ
jgi:colanic acid biosynthesis glycosyl transferase WcaI